MTAKVTGAFTSGVDTIEVEFNDKSDLKEISENIKKEGISEKEIFPKLNKDDINVNVEEGVIEIYKKNGKVKRENHTSEKEYEIADEKEELEIEDEADKTVFFHKRGRNNEFFNIKREWIAEEDGILSNWKVMPGYDYFKKIDGYFFQEEQISGKSMLETSISTGIEEIGLLKNGNIKYEIKGVKLCFFHCF